MTQDIGPEDEAAQGLEDPVDQQDSRKKRSSAWPWVALAVVLLLIIWLIWQYLEGVSNGAERSKVTVSRVVPATPGSAEPSPRWKAKSPPGPMRPIPACLMWWA